MDTNSACRIEIRHDHTLAGQIDRITSALSASRGLTPAAIVATPSFAVAGGTSGTLEAIENGHVEVVAGRYPQASATGPRAVSHAELRHRRRQRVDPATGLIYITETSSHRLGVITRVDPSKPSTWTIAPLANSAGTAGFADGRRDRAVPLIERALSRRHDAVHRRHRQLRDPRARSWRLP
jgi:hypothetical protein